MLPPFSFLVVSLGLGLAVGVAFGAVITSLSQGWSYPTRFTLLIVSVAAGVPVVVSSRNLLHRDKNAKTTS